MNSGQGSPSTQNVFPSVSGANIMAGSYIKLSIFNGNELEDTKKHWFLCEVVWTM